MSTKQSFPLTHVFGVTRAEYYRITGITAEDLIRFYEAENVAMQEHINNLRKWIRREKYGTRKSRYMLKLYQHITIKIEKNRQKLNELKNDLNHSQTS